jgi:hypothetical protein
MCLLKQTNTRDAGPARSAFSRQTFRSLTFERQVSGAMSSQ